MRTSTAGRPGSSRGTTRCSVPLTSARTRSATVTPWDRAKPRAALVGVWSGPNAAAVLGPLTVRVWSSSRAATESTIATMRRGVASTLMASCRSLVAARRSVNSRWTWSVAARASAGGISSVPISKTSRRHPTAPATSPGALSEASPADATVGADGICGGGARPSGWPSSSRREIHSRARSPDRRRMSANALARSAVDTAPRESRTLKAWEHLST